MIVSESDIHVRVSVHPPDSNTQEKTVRTLVGAEPEHEAGVDELDARVVQLCGVVHVLGVDAVTRRAVVENARHVERQADVREPDVLVDVRLQRRVGRRVQLQLDHGYPGDVMLDAVTGRVLAGALTADAQVKVLARLAVDARADDEALTLVTFVPNTTRHTL